MATRDTSTSTGADEATPLQTKQSLEPARTRRGQLLRVPTAAQEEHVDVMLQQSGCRIERIVSFGQVSPPGFWYEQTENEWVLLVSGSARLAIDGEPEMDLQPGQWIYIPARVRHRVTRTAPDVATVWLAVFTPPAHPTSAPPTAEEVLGAVRST